MTTVKTPEQQWAAKKRRLDALKPSTATCTLCDDPALRIQLADARAELADAEAALNALDETSQAHRPFHEQQVATARTALDAAQKAFDARAVTLTFQALPREDLEALETKHPVTEEDEADGKAFADSFMPELIAAASLDGMPVEDARRYLNTWQPADAQDLWAAAYGVQQKKRTDLGKG